jgi:outer membrane protein TolC
LSIHARSQTIIRHRTLLIGFACASLGLAQSAASAVQSIDLTQAINYALAQNRDLARSALDVGAARYGIDASQAEFRLSVRPEASATGTTENSGYSYGLVTSKKLMTGTTLSIGGGVEDIPDDLGGLGLRQGQRVQVAISQPIFRNFGRLIHGEGIIQANNDLKTAQRQYELQKNDLVINVVETYESLLRLQRQVESDTDSFKRMDDLHRVTQAHELIGKTTRVDTLRVALLRGEAASRLEIAKERLASTQKDFVELLGFPLETEFELTPVPVLTFDIPEVDEAIAIALRNRVDYAQVLQDREDSLRNVQIARRSLLPDVRLTVGHEWWDQNTISSDGLELDDNVWFFRVSVGTDLNPAIERAELSRAQLQNRSSSQLVEIIQLSIARLVQQHLLAHRRAREELDIARRNFDLAASRAKLTRRLFELGRENNFSVTDAETALVLSEHRLFLARSESVNSGYRLMRALGTLVESPQYLKP